jgi:hypothetical protein
MVFYINDASLQGQFATPEVFEDVLRDLINLRKRNQSLAASLRTTRSLSYARATFGATLRNVVQASRDRTLRIEVLTWLDRTGPFIDDDRLSEADDYFECLGVDVTDGGLGEAARRIKAGENASTFSFEGGALDFADSPLVVEHGLPEERLGSFCVSNIWRIDDLLRTAVGDASIITSWRAFVLSARERFSHLIIPDNVFLNSALAREAFDPAIRDRTLALLGYLNAYMAGRLPTGAEGPQAREIIDNFFVGENALFTGESATNQRTFKEQLTFVDPEDPAREIFAHWHGKIRRRFFRMHFEWPLPPEATKLKILYLGPKITRD